MADTDLSLGLFGRWYKICLTYIHHAATGGGTTCPYEQLTDTSPTIMVTFNQKVSCTMLMYQSSTKKMANKKRNMSYWLVPEDL